MESELEGQAQAWQLVFGFVDSMVIKCAIELQIVDIIHSHGAPISLSELASGIDSPNPPNLGYLERVMRYLVRKKVFEAFHQTGDGITLYGVTDVSKWLISNSNLSLSPMATTMNHDTFQASWKCLSQCVKQGGFPFEIANGSQIWDFASQNPSFNNLFQQAMSCSSNITIKAVTSTYKDGFSGVKTLVNVAGGTGETLIEILKVFPHIKGINFDLPHVIAIANVSPGISHVEGDMFKLIPSAEVVLLKWILHDWGDEDCVKILKNCRKALPDTTGKLILLELLVQPNDDKTFGNIDLVFDVTVLAVTNGGKERSEVEWKVLLEQGGFPRYKSLRFQLYYPSLRRFRYKVEFIVYVFSRVS